MSGVGSEACAVERKKSAQCRVNIIVTIIIQCNSNITIIIIYDTNITLSLSSLHTTL